ncbi:MAG: Tn3 family transposase, partial [Gammaproteobacteria bacterium]|nr:Tn3 family transposase [Gammaproteobacteria bacterium]
KISQLKQFTDERKLYLRLIAFLQHQYYSRQDIFSDIFLRSVRSTKNSALHQLKNEDQLTRSERRTAVKHLTKSRQGYKSLIDEITEVTHSVVFTDTGKVQKIAELLKKHTDEESKKEQKKIEQFEKSLDELAKDKNYFDILESLSRKLQNRVSDILKVISFNPENSDKILLNAADHYKNKDGEITINSPQDFLSSDEKEALVNENGTFRTSLYKILLFIHIADGIKSGKLNLKHSYRYLAIQDYLVDKVTWKSQRNELLKLAWLEEFSDYNVVMKKFVKLLDEKYHTVNQRVSNNLNPYLSFDEKSKNYIQINTPALEEKETKHISVFLNQLGYIPVLRVLSDVNHVTKFTKSFTHHSVKNSKTKADAATFYAGIIGLGCNIGVPKMAQISSGINKNTMSTAVNWFFSLKTLNAANECIREFINRLALPNIFAETENQRHGSSDGRKVGVSVECLLAAYSFKYFGKDSGVSVYTFIDDRQVLFHHTVISASEREAAYVIDGLNNMDVPKIDIHSTDTHGYTELIFATMHFLSTSFAPRIKNIAKQKIYAFSTKKSYEKLGYKILPCRPIRQKLIAEHWEDILRFMVTIRLNKVSASQLFKRLSSYAKDNPLYKAIKEFGRIVKSLFVLTYFDDVKLRQRIEKQLNRIESSNKFARAIFYANNSEFKQSDPEEQNIAVACKVLIQNSIVLWNYLYLSQLLTNCADAKERAEMISLIREGSVLTWSHVNLHGEFDFRQKAANESFFNLARILALKVV